ncbi:hypothetical protein CCMSSC00406_0002836 [Pleurotus cornucopiae]|uniref:Uncharacterized protein n=1 Tax=Pleurotus cornucopiae TaxID=5321 RepID=A0ACB7J016_PLECO|nr:hypothetical protein CCMSSC00406_0002836 [Pleurotus cornucopiae]
MTSVLRLLVRSCTLVVIGVAAIPTSRTSVMPRNTLPKLVVAHFMVGNTYPYSVDDWTKDIALAHSKGIDGFALNVGGGDWQPLRVADAYSAAANSGTNFKLFLSLDMTSMSCSSKGDAAALRSYITAYASHPNQLSYSGRVLVSTFSGENCYFGASNVDAGWQATIKDGLPGVFFLPSFFVDPTTFKQYPVADGFSNWNGGWPMGNYDVDFESDNGYLSNLGGRAFMGAVSPWFFTHYGPESFNKNWIYRSDDWLFARRWEDIIANRDRVDIAEVITWNDYGESHYIGPIEGAQPNSQAWVNGFDHQGWLDLNQYYIEAYKIGSYPSISRDRVFLWARLFPAAASTADSVSRPEKADFTQDFLWAVVLLTSPGQVTLACGPSVQTTNVPAGLAKLKLPLTSDCDASSTVSRDGRRVIDFQPNGFHFSTNPTMYNFNAFVAASP